MNWYTQSIDDTLGVVMADDIAGAPYRQYELVAIPREK
jgi:hypothetical protein